MTLEQLTGETWPAATEEDSYLVERVIQLMKQPVDGFTPADLRLLVSQKIALEHVLPLALDVLAPNPLMDVEYFPGDLLEAALAVDETVWQSLPELHTRFIFILELLESTVDDYLRKIRPKVIHLLHHQG